MRRYILLFVIVCIFLNFFLFMRSPVLNADSLHVVLWSLDNLSEDMPTLNFPSTFGAALLGEANLGDVFSSLFGDVGRAFSRLWGYLRMIRMDVL